MHLLLQFAISAVLLAPAGPSSVAPDSGSVRVVRCRQHRCSVQFRRRQEQLQFPLLSPEEKMALLMDEHRLHLPIMMLIDDSGYEADDSIRQASAE